jgi:hypothetical protein
LVQYFWEKNGAWPSLPEHWYAQKPLHSSEVRQSNKDRIHEYTKNKRYNLNKALEDFSYLKT